MKTAAQEWEGVTALAIDVDPRRFSADALAAELVQDRSVVEVGLTEAGVMTPVTVDRDLATDAGTPIRPGDLVVDPFAGSGTTALACAIEGRRCITSEEKPEHHEIARRRLARGHTPSMFT